MCLAARPERSVASRQHTNMTRWSAVLAPRDPELSIHVSCPTVHASHPHTPASRPASSHEPRAPIVLPMLLLPLAVSSKLGKDLLYVPNMTACSIMTTIVYQITGTLRPKLSLRHGDVTATVCGILRDSLRRHAEIISELQDIPGHENPRRRAARIGRWSRLGPRRLDPPFGPHSSDRGKAESRRRD